MSAMGRKRPSPGRLNERPAFGAANAALSVGDGRIAVQAPIAAFRWRAVDDGRILALMKKGGRLDSSEQAREKQAARDADAHDLASGRRSAAEIQHANNMFSALGPAALRNARVIFPEKE